MAKTCKHYTENYTRLDNTIVDDPDISFKALGLMVYMWRQPSDWYFTVELIAKNRKEGVTAVRTALTELEDAGYLLREYQLVDGKVDNVIYHISDTPEYKEQNEKLKRENKKRYVTSSNIE